MAITTRDRVEQINKLIGKPYLILDDSGAYYESNQEFIKCDFSEDICIPVDEEGSPEYINRYITECMMEASHLCPHEESLFGEMDKYLSIKKHLSQRGTIMAVDMVNAYGRAERRVYERGDINRPWRKWPFNKEIPKDFLTRIGELKDKRVNKVVFQHLNGRINEGFISYDTHERCIKYVDYITHNEVLISKILLQEDHHGVIDTKFFNGSSGEGRHVVHDITIAEDGMSLVIKEETLQDDWWGSGMVGTPMVWLDKSTPYNRPMHGFLPGPVYMGEQLWVCDKVLTFVKMEGKWVPVQPNSLGLRALGLYSEQVYDEYAIFCAMG